MGHPSLLKNKEEFYTLEMANWHNSFGKQFDRSRPQKCVYYAQVIPFPGSILRKQLCTEDIYFNPIYLQERKSETT